MGTVTITSGVHVGQRGVGSINQAWFASTPTTQFSAITLSSVGGAAQVTQGPQRILGHPGIEDEPVAFEFTRRTRDVLTDQLAAVVVKDLLNGGSRATSSGFRDAVARAGFLARFDWCEPRGSSPSSPRQLSLWGVARVSQASVRGLEQNLTLLVYPCSLLWWSRTESVFVTPTAYAALPAAP